ncbi:LysM domain-containing protein [Anaerospora hongkongensis]|uniref:LysM domain-containing protein n=1 Tax=Anaerospora hongkongensis TaxID=244830 RepID=A0A4R1PW24_9FIRM|nr:LysM domain-containing protein [Anaerospora hongkongensis]TCL35652.1 LysM domain-containing protein [Anaerospora hongkongensis]
MSYYFFMGDTQLPVPPAKMQLRINNKNKTINLINDGEVNILKSAGLSEVSFEVLLPNSKYPFATYFEGFRSADHFLNGFKQLKTSFSPFQFIVCRLSPRYDFLFDTNLKVALEDYEIIEDANNGFDVLTSVRLKQYKPYATKVLNVKTAEDGTKTASIEQKRETSREIPKAYKVVAGQTLFEICKKQLGDGSRWQEIAKLNSITNPNILVSGQVIKFG